MLSFIELAFLIAVFWALRWLSRWLKAYVARVERKDLRTKTLAVFAALLPFAAPGQQRIAPYLIWLPLQLLIVLALYVGYCMARIAYWDHEVRQLCAKDGGVQIFERIEISKAEAELLSDGGTLGVTPLELSKSGSPVYSDIKVDQIHQLNPSVSRWSEKVIRLSDKKIIAVLTIYRRGGGDPVGPWESSKFSCPSDSFGINKSIQSIFSIKSES